VAQRVKRNVVFIVHDFIKKATDICLQVNATLLAESS
jgi:hypothetical protein